VTKPPVLFETLRVRDGAVPLIAGHMRRLHDASHSVGLALPPESLGMVVLTWARERPGDHVLRLEWDGHDVAWSDRPALDAAAVRVVTVSEPHPGYPVKSVGREVFDRALAEAEAAGADEPLLLAAGGCVAETSRFAIAWLDGDRLHVPDLTLGILPSVGRARLVEVAAGAGLAVHTVSSPRAALEGKAVVLVNAVQGPLAVTRLDGAQVPDVEALARLCRDFWPPT
jgi:branched-subunit amino acid aminotransferase/4-amino-4-deoxychorismate lyase